MLLPEIIPVVLAAANNLGVPPNRTQLQKLLYFVTDMMGHAPVHRPHYYGPYSAVVAEATLDLVDLDVVKEDCRVSWGPLDATEIRQYSYSLTKTGGEVGKLISKESPAESKKIENLVQRLLESGGKDTNALAIAAKVHYILKRDPNIAPKNTVAIIQYAARLGWEINTDNVIQAIGFLERTNLIPQR